MSREIKYISIIISMKQLTSSSKNRNNFKIEIIKYFIHKQKELIQYIK